MRATAPSCKLVTTIEMPAGSARQSMWANGKLRMFRNIPYMFPILRGETNLQYIFQYLESWEPIPKVLTVLAGRRKCSTARQPTSKPLFEHKMTQYRLLLTSKSPPNVTSQSLKTLSERLGLFTAYRPIIDCGEQNFWLHTAFDPKIPDFLGDQYPIYIPILRGQLTNIQYQYLESSKTIFLRSLSPRLEGRSCGGRACFPAADSLFLGRE